VQYTFVYTLHLMRKLNVCIQKIMHLMFSVKELNKTLVNLPFMFSYKIHGWLNKNTVYHLSRKNCSFMYICLKSQNVV
jgi:hypothetical protein